MEARRATAAFDCRLLPGQTKDDILKWFWREIVGRASLIVANPELRDQIKIEEIQYVRSTESRSDTEQMAAIQRTGEKHDRSKTVVTTPGLAMSTTDSNYFRELGIITYGAEMFGFSAGSTEEDRAHGLDERVSERNVKDATRKYITFLMEIAARR